MILKMMRIVFRALQLAFFKLLGNSPVLKSSGG